MPHVTNTQCSYVLGGGSYVLSPSFFMQLLGSFLVAPQQLRSFYLWSYPLSNLSTTDTARGKHPCVLPSGWLIRPVPYLPCSFLPASSAECPLHRFPIPGAMVPHAYSPLAGSGNTPQIPFKTHTWMLAGQLPGSFFPTSRLWR